MHRLKLLSPFKPVQLLGPALWSSFLWAGIASMLFFSAFDPVTLGQVATFETPLSPLAGYTIGFFGFWFLGSVCSLSTLFLLGQVRLERH